MAEASTVLDEARRAVARACHGLAGEGLLIGTAGNVSVRAGEHVAVTATGVVLGRAEPSDVTVVDLAGARARRATSRRPPNWSCTWGSTALRRGRGGAHAFPAGHRGVPGARRAAVRALPAARAGRGDPGRAVRRVRLHGAGRRRRSPRWRASRRRCWPTTARSPTARRWRPRWTTRCCWSGRAACTCARRRSARRGCWGRSSRRPSVIAAVQSGYGRPRRIEEHR